MSRFKLSILIVVILIFFYLAAQKKNKIENGHLVTVEK